MVVLRENNKERPCMEAMRAACIAAAHITHTETYLHLGGRILN